jgi:hypothetical protein
MANVHIEVPHRLGATVAQSRLAGFADDLARVGAKLQWKGTRAESTPSPRWCACR